MTNKNRLIAVGALAVFALACEAGRELANNYNELIQHASDEHAIDACAQRGGVPIALADPGDHHELTCAVPKSMKVVASPPRR
jgi:hypothetical protein